MAESGPASAGQIRVLTAKAAEDCRSPKRKRVRKRILPPKVLDCGSPLPLSGTKESETLSCVQLA